MSRIPGCTCTNIAPDEIHFKGCPAVTPPKAEQWEDRPSVREQLRGRLEALHPQYFVDELTWEHDRKGTDEMIDALLYKTLATHTQELRKLIEGKRKKHWVFECSGPRPNKTTKFEDFCDDPECRSIDNQQVIAHNALIADLLTALPLLDNMKDKHTFGDLLLLMLGLARESMDTSNASKLTASSDIIHREDGRHYRVSVIVEEV